MKIQPIIVVLIFLYSTSRGQNNYSLNVIISDSVKKDLSFLKKKYPVTLLYNDTIRLRKEVETILFDLRREGFLAASIDSIKKDSLQITAFVYSGDKYYWAMIRQGNVPVELLDGTGYRKKLYYGKPLQYEKLALLNTKILNNCENKGFPFAAVFLDSVEIKENKISAALSVKKNQFIHVDSIIIKGNIDVSPVYLYNYIGIAPGDVYKESLLRKISGRLRELPFVKEIKPSQVFFGEKESKLYLFLENKKASQFDGVIGILPDASNGGKINLTGEVHLKLQNSLRHGEIIELNWKQLPVKSQDLKVHVLYPFLLNTPFGIDGSLAIFKKDTTYIDVIKNLGIQYALTGNNYFKVFINDKQSDLQSTSGLENITTLPP